MFVLNIVKGQVIENDGLKVPFLGMSLVYYLIFNLVESIIEKIIFGEAFPHPLDYVFVAVFVVYVLLGFHLCNAHRKWLVNKRKNT